jgi:endo-1,4-beta-xylanase
MNRIVIICLLICSLCTGCNPDENIQPAEGLHHNWNFPIGTAIRPFDTDATARTHGVLLRHFNSLTGENVFKMRSIWQSQDQFQFKWTDQIVSFAKEKNYRVHGHTLLWHAQVPDWLLSYEAGQEEWDKLLKHYITTVVQHFGDDVESWDVVNEAFLHDGTLRNTFWRQRLGDGYIEKAFRYAHEANPDVLLFYNDYDLAINPVKRKAVMRYMKQIRERGVPVHGIGMQMHIAISYPENHQIVEAFDDVTRAGFKLHVSELDVSVNPFSKEMDSPDAELLQRQSDKYVAIFNAFNRLPDDLQHGITVWGIGDRDSWIPAHFNRSDFPLLFDFDYEPKQALHSLLK